MNTNSTRFIGGEAARKPDVRKNKFKPIPSQDQDYTQEIEQALDDFAKVMSLMFIVISLGVLSCLL